MPACWREGISGRFWRRSGTSNRLFRNPSENSSLFLNRRKSSHAVINHKDNAYTAEVVSKHPEHFSGYARSTCTRGQLPSNPWRGQSAPWACAVSTPEALLWTHLHPNHRRYYPLYSKCIELGIPVSIHCSMHYATGRSTDFSRPIYLDDVAMDFPELTLIARARRVAMGPGTCRTGPETPKYLYQYRSHRPRYLGTSGTGWESLLHFGQNLLRERVVFGSAWMTLGMSLQEVYDEFEGLPINGRLKIFGATGMPPGFWKGESITIYSFFPNPIS